jgi:hypothetical protein
MASVPAGCSSLSITASSRPDSTTGAFKVAICDLESSISSEVDPDCGRADSIAEGAGDRDDEKPKKPHRRFPFVLLRARRTPARRRSGALHLSRHARSRQSQPAGKDRDRDVRAQLGGLADGGQRNTASAVTGPDCRTTVTAPTACLNVLMEQHEQVHRNACRDHQARSIGPSDALFERWQTLADYAREEIEGYKEERRYIEAALSNLERDCRYTLEFDSTIAGSTETTKAEAKTKVDLQVHFPRGVEPLGLAGSKPLEYNTRDVGPPKVMGHSMLKKLFTNCYVASVGSGNVSFEVREAWMMRETQPPYGPLLMMPIYVGETQETRHMKGPRGCPRKSEPIPFWSEQFKLSKEGAMPVEADSRSGSPASGPGVIIADWNFSDASGDEAQKAIRTTCAGWGGMQEMAAAYAGLPTEAPTCEWTNLKIKRKR